ncbi:MAG: hypothetical protein EPO00_11525 [Chloroflexota bacterium]|nr:MAG: hypothetical protein EPO00_11525 [Chloroflexota bacterium]
MTTNVVAAGTTRDSARPYARSWLDVFFGAMTALPGPTWVAYAVLTTLSILLSNSALWLSGLRPWGELDAQQVYWGATTAGIAAAAHHLRNLAGASFDRFRPALGSGIPDPERVRYELTVMPAVPVAAITLFSFAVTPLYYLTDPVASQVVGLTPVGLGARVLSEGAATTVFLAVAFQAVRQLRAVTRLHRDADGVDPFRPVPLYAFSRLTSQTGIVLVLWISGGVLANPAALDVEGFAALWLPWLVFTPLVAIVVFVLPLLGMHGRLEAEKDDLEEAADGRMRDLVRELNEAIDARAADRVERVDRMVSALRHERELLARLPTWPWSTGTIRGFGSALLLPLVLFLIQRYLGAALGG